MCAGITKTRDNAEYRRARCGTTRLGTQRRTRKRKRKRLRVATGRRGPWASEEKSVVRIPRPRRASYVILSADAPSRNGTVDGVTAKARCAASAREAKRTPDQGRELFHGTSGFDFYRFMTASRIARSLARSRIFAAMTTRES